LYFTGSA
jgi:DNA polymerase/3'-5' exonuclease PolX